MKIHILNKQSFIHHPVESEQMMENARTMLLDLSKLYPGFAHWFDHKVQPGVKLGERSVIAAISANRLVGAAIVKTTPYEEKLCCLRVVNDLKGSGLGLKLFERSFEVLRNESPLLSISEENYDAFAKIFRHYGFEFAKAYDGIYRPRKLELSFNGLLIPDTSLSGAIRPLEVLSAVS